MTGTWVRRKPEVRKHACPAPKRRTGVVDPNGEPIYLADGSWRDLWRCDECGKLWRHTLFDFWRSAWWWQRRRYLTAAKNG